MCYRFARQESAKRAQWQLKKHIIQIPTGLNGNSATNTRRRFLKEEKQNEKKKERDFTDLESSPRVSRQNKFNLASFSAYPLELTKQQRDIIVL